MAILEITNGYFGLADEGQIRAKKSFEYSNEVTKFIDKLLNKYDDQHSLYYRGNFYR